MEYLLYHEIINFDDVTTSNFVFESEKKLDSWKRQIDKSIDDLAERCLSEYGNFLKSGDSITTLKSPRLELGVNIPELDKKAKSVSKRPISDLNIWGFYARYSLMCKDAKIPILSQ